MGQIYLHIDYQEVYIDTEYKGLQIWSMGTDIPIHRLSRGVYRCVCILSTDTDILMHRLSRGVCIEI